MTKVRPAGAELFYGSGQANIYLYGIIKRVWKLGAAFDTHLFTTGRSIQESCKWYSLFSWLMQIQQQNLSNLKSKQLGFTNS
jgi:hypothetical protein